MTTSSFGLTAEEAALIAKINELINRVKAKLIELQNAISAQLSSLPAFLRDRALTKWANVTTVMNEAWRILAEAGFSASIGTQTPEPLPVGSPSALYATANTWSDKVSGPVTGTVQSITAASLKVDDSWQGRAASRYLESLPSQTTALDKIRFSLCDGITATLAEIAKAITAFWTSVLLALLVLIAALATAAVTAAGVLPAIILILVGLVIFLGTLASSAATLRAVCGAANVTLRQKLNDNTAFGGGHWPRTTVQ